MEQKTSINTNPRDRATDPVGLLSLLASPKPGIAIGVKGPDRRYQMSNEALQSLFGKSAQEFSGLSDAELFEPELAAKLQRGDEQIAMGAATACEEFDLSLDGVSARYLWLKFPIMGEDGKTRLIGTLMIDLALQEQATQLRQTLSQLQQANQELQVTVTELDQLASTDKLTGAWNRRRLEEAVRNEMDRLKRYDHPLSLLMMDIDFFKKVNDQHGHPVGDLVLSKLAEVVQTTIRTTDALARWGGEEFVVLCPNTPLGTAALLAERLREKIAQTDFPVVKDVHVSVGVAECLAHESWDAWLGRADAALYRAKTCGRNQVQVASEITKRKRLGENVAANFVQLSWHSAYECGNAHIDEQHRGLFRDANQLLTAILDGRPAQEVSALIDVLIDDVVKHFHDEEVIIAAANYPGATEHAVIHRTLVNTAAELANRFHAGNLALGELFEFLAHDLVARHMLGADREFFPYLAAQRQE